MQLYNLSKTKTNKLIKKNLMKIIKIKNLFLIKEQKLLNLKAFQNIAKMITKECLLKGRNSLMKLNKR